MKNLNIPLISALLLTILAFFAHTIGGDMEIWMLQPSGDSSTESQQIWTMVRCGWHWISFDLLLASIGIGLVTFTGLFESPKTILQLITFYFFGYGIVWLIVITISPSFEFSFLKLGQWILLWAIAGLTYLGRKKVKHASAKA